MTGKVVVVTGATSGIGQFAAENLATQGARVILIARDPNRGQPALERLNRLGEGAEHQVYYCDLSSVAETRRLGNQIAAAENRIDTLINNAGALFSSYQLTPEGFERTFALNHLAYFVLTQSLCDRLTQSAPARIINTSSAAHKFSSLDFDDLQCKGAYRAGLAQQLRYGGGGFKVYGRSKLCNVLFTRYLGRHLQGMGVTVNCFHPGFVATRFGDSAGGLAGFGIRVAKRLALSVQEGADTLIYLASAPEVSQVSGEYFYKRHVAATSSAAGNDEAAERLWRVTEDMVAKVHKAA